MGYTNSTLTTGESIQYKGKVHGIIYVGAIIWLVLGLLMLTGGKGMLPVSMIFIVLGVILGLNAFIICKTSEFIVTSKRVVMKTGLIKRSSTDIMLTKMETINVDQSILGRIFNYGTLLVGGSGGTKNGFKGVANPLEFRKRVQIGLESVQ
jgi:uncharacterized membrane protein YdbT with pleckstrin-like domain